MNAINTSLAELRRSLAGELQAAQRRVTELERAMEELDRIAPLLSPSATRSSAPTRSGVTARAALLDVLEDSDHPLNDTELHDAAVGRGWASGAKDTLNSIRAELYRMRKAELIVRLGSTGPYRLRQPSDTTDVIEPSENASGPTEVGPLNDHSRSADGTADPNQREEVTKDDDHPHHHPAPLGGS